MQVATEQTGSWQAGGPAGGPASPKLAKRAGFLIKSAASAASLEHLIFQSKIQLGWHPEFLSSEDVDSLIQLAASAPPWSA